MRIAPDGEVEAQGPIVFGGYWQDPQATSEVFDGRWLRTGDLGALDDDEMTQTQKVRRDNVLAKFATDVDALYS